MEVVERGDTDFIGNSSKIVSLGLDEVNDNPEELVEMRGEGRYFGVSDAPTGIICSNCHQRGHKRAQCKTVVCTACGMLNDHYSNQCPKSIVCSNCGEKGHLLNQCTQRLRRIYCQTCASAKHTADQCPSIWRSYITINDDRRMGLPTNIYCYNCADKGHYGDECPERRSSRVPNLDGSAFSGYNLPQQLRDKYFNLHHKRRRDDDNDSVYYGSGHREDDYYDEPQQKKKGFVEKIKNAFSSKKKKKNAENEPSRKKTKYNDDDQQLRKAQSMPIVANRPSKTGFLPPKGPKPKGPRATNSTYDFPRNNNNNNNTNNGGSYNSRSGYLKPQEELKPSRSGSVSSRFAQKKRRF